MYLLWRIIVNVRFIKWFWYLHFFGEFPSLKFCSATRYVLKSTCIFWIMTDSFYPPSSFLYRRRFQWIRQASLLDEEHLGVGHSESWEQRVRQMTFFYVELLHVSFVANYVRPFCYHNSITFYYEPYHSYSLIHENFTFIFLKKC